LYCVEWCYIVLVVRGLRIGLLLRGAVVLEGA